MCTVSPTVMAIILCPRAEMATWLGLPNLQPTHWPLSSSSIDWWTIITMRLNTPRKASRSFTLLLSCEIRKERNSRVFDRVESSIPTLLDKIKLEFSLWILVGAKCLASVRVRTCKYPVKLASSLGCSFPLFQ
jgi:hypothetical protein